MTLDGNWLVHWPKVGWWLACEANLAYFIGRFYQPSNVNVSPAEENCDQPGWLQTASALLVVSPRKRLRGLDRRVPATCGRPCYPSPRTR